MPTMTDQDKAAIACMAMAFISFLFGIGVGHRATATAFRESAVRHGAAEWVADEHGAATFQFINQKQEN